MTLNNCLAKIIPMKNYNLVLSGGGVRSYAHLGVYKYCYENGIIFDEIVAVSGGGLIAPFICLRKNPDEIINLFTSSKIHKMLFPFWFMPNKFEFLLKEADTIKLGNWLEKHFTEDELNKLQLEEKLHIMACRNPVCGNKALYTDMLKITDLKNAIASTCAISGIFKEHRVGDCTYIDGGHWNNCPIFFEFNDNHLPLIAVNLGYSGLLEKPGGKISKIIRGFDISSYARVQEDIVRWEFEKTCNKRGELFVVNPTVWNVRSLVFNLKDWQIKEIIESGYKAVKESLSIKEVVAKV